MLVGPESCLSLAQANGVMLSSNHFSIKAIFSDQDVVGSFFHNLAFFDDNNLIGVSDRGKSMGDDKCRPIF